LPLKSGLFQGRYDRFREVAEAYREGLTNVRWD